MMDEKVGTASGASTAAATTKQRAEDAVEAAAEEVIDTDVDSLETARTKRRATRPVMTEHVVLTSLLRDRENRVSLLDFLEFHLSL